jgi:hypothetical protein
MQVSIQECRIFGFYSDRGVVARLLAILQLRADWRSKGMTR